ncbi:MAG: hypothetical protein RI993_818, partial [Pseudomonadota bacterium]
MQSMPRYAASHTILDPSIRNSVLRNTYLMLSLTMIPTVIGAFMGLSTNFSFLAESPIIGSLVMLAAMIGLMFAVSATRN